MRGSNRAFLGMVAALLVLWMVSAQAAAKRVALVVGNSDYRYTTGLRNPRNDANDVAAALRRLGFSVISGMNLGVDGFYDKIAQFRDATRGSSVALLFYAGHGIQVDGENYLVPVDADLRNKLDLRRGAVALDDVMEAMRGETRLVFLDACRSNPFSQFLSSTRGSSRGLARVVQVGGGSENHGGTLIAFATAPDDVADDGAGRNSPFTAALLRHISAPGISVTDMLTRVRKTVMDSTGGRQVPWSNDALLQVFHFVPPSGAETFATPASRCRFRLDNEDVEWSGRCIGGLAFGQGRATGPGWSYSGRAARGKPVGRGSIEIADGLRIEGNFLNGELSGRGTFFLPDGSRMEGTIIEYELVGWVELFYPDGGHLRGRFSDGEFKGQVFLDKPNGESCSAYVFGGDIEGARWDCYP